MRAHGIMYHHFHDEKKHIVGQGSISAEKFNDMLDFYGKEHNIIGAEEFLQKSINNSLHPQDVCLTFDDGLLSQYDIAYPVIKDRGLTAFWFIYTSPLDGVLEKIEIYRHFRFSMFSDVELFYKAFWKLTQVEYPNLLNQLQQYNPDEYLKEFPFYTPNDKKFRYMRDRVLGEQKYNFLMDKMIIQYGYDVLNNSKKLWLTEENIRDLHNNGNIIGLHSYSHPMVMIKKSYSCQCAEYKKNKEQLEKITGEEIVSVSYPCNSYDIDTLKYLRDIGIAIGFRANMADVCIGDSRYEYPREDHANIIKLMEKRVSAK